MIAYILRRLGATLVVMGLVGLFVFLLLRLSPGDPAAIIAGDNATPEQIAVLRGTLGLDQSLPVQYLTWLGSVLQGDFGTSFASHLPVMQLVAQRIPATFELAGITTLICVPLALIIGIIAAMNRGSQGM